jgi:streptogramin lyase
MTTLDERAQAAAAGLRASSERLRPADGLDRLLGRRRRTARLAVVGAFALLAALLVVVVQLRPHERVVEPARPVSQRAIVSRYGFGDHLAASPGGGIPVRVLADDGGVWVVVARPAEPSTLMALAPAGLPRAAIPLGAVPAPTGAELAFGGLWTIDLLGELRRFDPATGRPMLEARVLEHGRDGGPSLTAAGDSLWVVDGGAAVRRIDPATGRVRASVSGPGVTFGSSLAAGEGALWATSDFGGQATRIDLGDGGLTRLATRAGGGVAAGEGAVWIGGHDRTLVRLDPASGQVEATVGVGDDNRAVAVGQGGVWVAAAGGEPSLSRVDPRTNLVTGELALDEAPRAVTVANGSVWVTTDAAVLRIDPKAF